MKLFESLHAERAKESKQFGKVHLIQGRNSARRSSPTWPEPRTIETVLCLLSCAVLVVTVRTSLRSLDYHSIVGALRYTPIRLIGAAVVTTVLSFAASAVRDRFALDYVRAKVPLPLMLVASLCGPTLDNVVGFGSLSERSIRTRILSVVDVSQEQVDHIIRFNEIASVTVFLALTAISLILVNASFEQILPLRLAVLHTLGGLLLAAIMVATVLRVPAMSSLEVNKTSRSARMPRLAIAEFLTSFLDAAGRIGTLLVLTPRPVDLCGLVAIFSVAEMFGRLSRIPGGFGAFEVVVFASLCRVISADHLVAALLAYRCVYFVLPVVVATAILAGCELRRRGDPVVMSAAERTFAGAQLLAPTFLSVITFAVGTMLIVSGATPAVDWRIAALQSVLPLWAVETSHLLATLAGVFLLFVARGLYQKLDGAWWLAFIVSSVNIALSLAKGLAFGETAVLVILVILLLATRQQFTRPAAFLRQRFTVGWYLATGAVIVAAIGILLFAFRDVPYRREIWWQFEFDAQASRALRAVLGASILAIAMALRQMLRTAPGRLKPPTEEEMSRASSIIREQELSAAVLALMGDKSFLFSASGRSFLMFAKRGRSWVALFDPIGDPQERPELIRRFIGTVVAHGGRAAFYQICPNNLPTYLDAGLQVMKVGEEAALRLEKFSLEGPERYGLRQAVRRAEREGITIDILESEQVGDQIPLLREISDNWLEHHRASELRFSVACFEPRFMTAQSVMIAYQGSRPLAFVSFMATKHRTEATIGLMRYVRQSPPYAMEFLLTQLALNLKTQGFKTLSLGMAPLAGLLRTPLSTRSHRLAILLWEHGGAIYNFQGLRSFKNKFRPVWEPRYLATSGTFGPFLTLADVAALASGYLRRRTR